MHVDITFKTSEGKTHTTFYDGVTRVRFSERFPHELVLSLKEDYTAIGFIKESNVSTVPFVHCYDSVTNCHISEF